MNLCQAIGATDRCLAIIDEEPAELSREELLTRLIDVLLKPYRLKSRVLAPGVAASWYPHTGDPICKVQCGLLSKGSSPVS